MHSGDCACFLGLPQKTTVKSGRRGAKYVKVPYVCESVGTQKWYGCLWSWLGYTVYESVGGRVQLNSIHTVACQHAYLWAWRSTHVGVHTFSTACHCRCSVFGNLQYLSPSLCECVFKLLFNFYFLFYSWPNPNATQLCSEPEKEGLGDGLPGPGECSHALQLLPTDGREIGLPAWAYLLFVGQTDPPLFPHLVIILCLNLSIWC